MAKVLIAEISGKRPGTKKERPTEKFKTHYDHIIISNNSEGYDAEWEIINVPDDYREWYISTVKSSENAWYAPMNRSYAIKYAREHGYDYLVQVDDNINKLEISTMSNGKRYRAVHHENDDMFDDFVNMLSLILDNSNAVMAGMALSSIAKPTSKFLKERYCYSFFATNLKTCPSIFQGDFEDDIEYRLKARQMSLPTLQCYPLKYGKTGQALNKDLTGCRAEYAKQGLKRGEHMCALYGDVYSCRMRNMPNSICAYETENNVFFKHYLKPFKVGTLIKDKKIIEDYMIYLFQKYGEEKPDKYIIKQKKVKNKVV